MISVDQKVKDIFEKNYNVRMQAGITMDINLNRIVNFEAGASTITGNTTPTINGKQPFKKLFPIDSIVKPFRPPFGGVKYAISGDIPLKSWASSPADNDYQPALGNTYRTYFPSQDIYYKYWVTPLNANAAITISYNKTLPSNKIVAKFELAHATPSAWTLKKQDGTVLKTGTSVGSNGVVTIYYDGTNWQTDSALLNRSSYVNLTALTLEATNPGGYVGVIELAPHYELDLTEDLVTFNITKESTRGSEDLLPVGNVSANSANISLSNYNTEGLKYRVFDKFSSSTIDSSHVYLVKHSEVNPYFKVYHADGPLTDSTGKYFKVTQGLYLLDSWSISEYGDVELFALDSAKILQETICPDMVCEEYSTVAIIRRMLDSVGFTNYQFFYSDDDKSIITPKYWWSDGTNTVWGNIQELCRDTQLTAVVGEDNILKFYSREYLYNSSSSANWTFRYDPSGTEPNVLLPNIIELSKKDLPTVNQVQVIYNTVYMANYQQNAGQIASVDGTRLAAAEIMSNLPVSADPATTPATKFYIQLKPITTIENKNVTEDILQSFNGYLLIDSEIVEYDAIQYQYQPANNTELVTAEEIASGYKKVDITGANDLSKYRGRAKQSIDNSNSSYKTTFAPTFKYRIKARGAFNTKIVDHTIDLKKELNGWKGFTKIVWKEK